MRRDFPYPFFLLNLLILLSSSCNAPLRKVTPTLAFTAEDLRQTVEAMPTYTPASIEVVADQSSSSEAIPGMWPTLIPTSEGEAYHYQILPGDTLAGVAGRFGVGPEQIRSEQRISLQGYLPPGYTLLIPRRLDATTSAQRLLPDAELVYSATAADFDVEAFIQQAGGYLNEHREMVEEGTELSGSEIIQRVASELSVNPRLLLALLEYRSGWVFSHPIGAEREPYPIGFQISDRKGLYAEIKIAATQLNRAYYGWREGSFTMLKFEGEEPMRLEPTLNAGTVAIMHLFAILSDREAWAEDIYSPYGFPIRYFNLFGDSWTRAEEVDVLIPDDLEQPALELPFLPGEGWSLTAGPHNAWNSGTPLGAVDFSPITAGDPCAPSTSWVTASAAGQVVRARENVVVLDLEGDRMEGRGWAIVYFHIGDQDMIPEGTDLAVDQRIGHPSCEGGIASGTHVHVARKYNGEWLPADGPVPFVMSGWRTKAGERVYQGELIRGDHVVTADPAGRAGSTITR